MLAPRTDYVVPNLSGGALSNGVGTLISRGLAFASDGLRVIVPLFTVLYLMYFIRYSVSHRLLLSLYSVCSV